MPASSARHAFDLAAPMVVATPAFRHKGVHYQQGTVLPWRELGFTETDVMQLWYTLKIDCDPHRAIHKVTPAEHVSVRTPEQAAPAGKKHRHAVR